MAETLWRLATSLETHFVVTGVATLIHYNRNEFKRSLLKRPPKHNEKIEAVRSMNPNFARKIWTLIKYEIPFDLSLVKQHEKYIFTCVFALVLFKSAKIIILLFTSKFSFLKSFSSRVIMHIFLSRILNGAAWSSPAENRLFWFAVLMTNCAISSSWSRIKPRISVRPWKR